MIDSLCDQARGKDTAIAALYCDFHAQQEQSTANMLGAILRQLAHKDGTRHHVSEAFQRAKKLFGSCSLGLPDAVEILKSIIAQLAQVFICIDGLDECTLRHRRELLESLREIVRESPNTRVFLTGRPHIDDEIMRCFSKAVQISLSPTHRDIKIFLENMLDCDPEPDAMDNELRADIMKIIPEKASEM